MQGDAANPGVLPQASARRRAALLRHAPLAAHGDAWRGGLGGGGLGLCRCGGAYRRKGKEPVLDLEAAAGALLEGVLGGEEAVQALEWDEGERGRA